LRSSHEPARRCLLSLVAAESMAHFVARSARLHLFARLAGPAQQKPPTLARRAARRLYRRARDGLPGPGLSHRAVRRAVPAGPHVGASTAHDGGAPADLAWGAAVSHVAWPSLASANILGRAPISIAPVAAVFRAADSPGGGAAALCRCHVAVAYAGSL